MRKNEREERRDNVKKKTKKMGVVKAKRMRDGQAGKKDEKDVKF